MLINYRLILDNQPKTSEVFSAMTPRQPFDLPAYIRDIQTRPCFICEMIAGNPEYTHHLV